MDLACCIILIPTLSSSGQESELPMGLPRVTQVTQTQGWIPFWAALLTATPERSGSRCTSPRSNSLLRAALGAGSQQSPDLSPAQGSTLLSKSMSSTQCKPDELNPIKGRHTVWAGAGHACSMLGFSVWGIFLIRLVFHFCWNCYVRYNSVSSEFFFFPTHSPKAPPLCRQTHSTKGRRISFYLANPSETDFLRPECAMDPSCPSPTLRFIPVGTRSQALMPRICEIILVWVMVGEWRQLPLSVLMTHHTCLQPRRHIQLWSDLVTSTRSIKGNISPLYKPFT